MSSRLDRYIEKLSACSNSELIDMAKPYEIIHKFNSKNKFFEVAAQINNCESINICDNFFYFLYKNLEETAKNGLSRRELNLYADMLITYTSDINLSDLKIKLNEFIESIPQLLDAFNAERFVENIDKQLDLETSRFYLIKQELRNRHIYTQISNKIQNLVYTNINHAESSENVSSYVRRCIDFIRSHHDLFIKVIGLAAQADISPSFNIELMPDNLIVACAHLLRYEEVKCADHSYLDMSLYENVFTHKSFEDNCFCDKSVYYDCLGREFDEYGKCWDLDDDGYDIEACCEKKYTKHYIDSDFFTIESNFTIDSMKCPCKHGEHRI